jgi:hypothetical protein
VVAARLEEEAGAEDAVAEAAVEVTRAHLLKL